MYTPKCIYVSARQFLEDNDNGFSNNSATLWLPLLTR